jgi:hypothetical protein
VERKGHMHGLEVSVLLMRVLSLICRYNKIPVKISGIYSADINKLILYPIWKHKTPIILHNIFKKEDRKGKRT